MVAEIVGGAACVAAGILAYGVRGRSSRLLGPSIHRGSPGLPIVALTFDDGPSESTPELLEILNRHRVQATFFQCGANVRRLPQVSREVAQAGHEIGNHTDSHPRLYLRSPRYIQDELARAQQAIHSATGTAPRLFRASYGARWFGLREAQRRLRLLGVMWTALGQDWKLPAEAVVARLLRRARNGAIFCLHDGRELTRAPDIRVTLGAVSRLIPALQQRGFRLDTISHMLEADRSRRLAAG